MLVEKYNQSHLLEGAWTFGYTEIRDNGTHVFHTFYKTGSPYMVQATEEGAEMLRQELDNKMNEVKK